MSVWEMPLPTVQSQPIRPQGRICGPCRECCVSFSILPHEPWWSEVKPAGVPCEFLCEQGCSIHDEPRPSPCEDYKCAYLLGHVPQRPDENGVMIGYVDLGPAIQWQDWLLTRHGWDGDDPAIQLVECRPGAVLKLDSDRIRYWFRKLGWRACVVIPHRVQVHLSKEIHLRSRLGLTCFVYWDGEQGGSEYAEQVIDWWRI